MTKLKETKQNEKRSKNPRNPFALPARLRRAGPLRNRNEKRLKNKQKEETFALLQSPLESDKI